MSDNIKFTDNRIEIKNIIKDKCLQFLVEASSLMTSQVQKNTKVKTRKTKNSWKFEINEEKLESQIGSGEENAIWEEFGTGEWALNGDGRKTAWSYKDKVTGKWYRTKGKKPKRALYNAYISTKDSIISEAESVMKEIK